MLGQYIRDNEVANFNQYDESIEPQNNSNSMTITDFKEAIKNKDSENYNNILKSQDNHKGLILFIESMNDFKSLQDEDFMKQVYKYTTQYRDNLKTDAQVAVSFLFTNDFQKEFESKFHVEYCEKNEYYDTLRLSKFFYFNGYQSVYNNLELFTEKNYVGFRKKEKHRETNYKYAIQNINQYENNISLQVNGGFSKWQNYQFEPNLFLSFLLTIDYKYECFGNRKEKQLPTDYSLTFNCQYDITNHTIQAIQIFDTSIRAHRLAHILDTCDYLTINIDY